MKIPEQSSEEILIQIHMLPPSEKSEGSQTCTKGKLRPGRKLNLGSKQLWISMLGKKQGRPGIRVDPTPIKGETLSLLNDKSNLLELQRTREPHKLSLIHDLIKAENPHVLLLQETKRKDTDILQDSSYIWRTCKGVAVSARGASGGNLHPVESQYLLSPILAVYDALD
jgi:hypothetical protein